MDVALSQLIACAPRVLLFDELVRMSQPPAPAAGADLGRANAVVDDIGLYLREVDLLVGRERERRLADVYRDDLPWYDAGRALVQVLARNLASCETLIRRLMAVVDLPDVNKHLECSHLRTKIDQTAEMLLEVHKLVQLLKQKVDTAASYRELHEMTIGLLDSEIEDCVQHVVGLQHRKLSSPRRLLTFSVHDVVSKMKTNTSGFSPKSLTLPTFTEEDAVLYNEYMLLEARIEPLRVSVDFLPLRVSEFSSMCSSHSPSLFPSSIRELDKSCQRLKQKWEYLCRAMVALKHDVIDAKWTEIFSHLVSEITKLVAQLHTDFAGSHKVTKSFSVNYKLCSNTITVINKAIAESILTDDSVIDDLHHKLVPQWTALNRQLAATKKESEPPADFGGLRSFHSTKRHSHFRQPSVDLPPGLGIDLGIDVESSRDPFSIAKTDRVQDIRSELPKILKPGLLNELKKAKTKDDDEDTLVSHKPLPQVEQVTAQLAALQVDWNDLKVPHKRYKCRIPIIVADYVHKGYPIIKKKYQSLPTRIPNISFEHPVFNSPQSPFKKIPSSSLGLQSPVRLDRNFNLNVSPTPKSAYGDDSDFKKPSRSPSRASSLQHSYKSPLNFGNVPSLGNTPNLTYHTLPSYKSTSPDRPTSSLGSRFDDEHLLQPLKLRNEKRLYYT